MELDGNTIKRLVFIKYMYEKAVKQSKRAYPESQMAVLTFHDSIELFLYLAYQKVGGSKKPDKISFLGYWDEIQGKFKKEITQKISIGKLDRARAELKHHGIFISESSIEEFRVYSKLFFEENTKNIFNVEFFELSLTDLVKNENVKNKLKNAEKWIKKNNFKNSIEEIAIAFAQLMDDNENKTRNLLGPSHPFFEKGFIENVHSCDVCGSYDSSPSDEMTECIMENFENLEYYILATQETVKLLSLNINYFDYMRFQEITPHILRRHDTTQKIEYLLPEKEQKNLFGDTIDRKEFNIEQVEFCLNFVIKTAIALQELNF